MSLISAVTSRGHMRFMMEETCHPIQLTFGHYRCLWRSGAVDTAPVASRNIATWSPKCALWHVRR
jgi:hypothetical protein